MKGSLNWLLLSSLLAACVAGREPRAPSGIAARNANSSAAPAGLGGDPNAACGLLPTLSVLVAQMPEPKEIGVGPDLLKQAELVDLGHSCGPGIWQEASLEIARHFVSDLGKVYQRDGVDLSDRIAGVESNSAGVGGVIGDTFETAIADLHEPIDSEPKILIHTDARLGQVARAIAVKPDAVPAAMESLQAALLNEVQRGSSKTTQERFLTIVTRFKSMSLGFGRLPRPQVGQALGGALDAYVAGLQMTGELPTPLWFFGPRSVSRRADLATLRRELSFDAQDLTALVLLREAERHALTVLEKHSIKAPAPKAEKPEERKKRLADLDTQLDQDLAGTADMVVEAFGAISTPTSRLEAIEHFSFAVGRAMISNTLQCRWVGAAPTLDESENCARIHRLAYASRSLSESALCLALDSALERPARDCRRHETAPMLLAECKPGEVAKALRGHVPPNFGRALDLFLDAIDTHWNELGSGAPREASKADLRGRTTPCDLAMLASASALDELGASYVAYQALALSGAQKRYPWPAKSFAGVVGRAFRHADRVVDDACVLVNLPRGACTVAALPAEKDGRSEVCAKAVEPIASLHLTLVEGTPSVLDAIAGDLGGPTRTEVDRFGLWTRKELSSCRRK